MKDEELQAALWEIARAVATVDSTGFIEAYGSVCPFCTAISRHGSVKHGSDCIVTKARNLTEKGLRADI